MEENTEKQNKKQYDWLKGYQFVKGQSGNPGGRPKGKSLKTFAREFLESLPDDEKINYLRTLPAEIVWKMAEGNPENNTDITSGGKELTPLLVKFLDKEDNKDNKETNIENNEDSRHTTGV